MTHYLFHVYILPLLYVASLMCYASHICCAGQPAVLLCALHYVGSGARPYLYPVTDSPIIIPTIIVTWKHTENAILKSGGLGARGYTPIYELSDSCEISEPSDNYDDDDLHHPQHHDHDNHHHDYHDDDDDDDDRDCRL